MVGVGVDIVDVRRFRAALDRTPGLVARVFTVREVELSGGDSLRLASLAARWAAKEAVAKVLVDNRGLEWHDCEIVNGDLGEPILSLSGTVERAAQALGIEAWHLSLSHDGDMAIAFALATRGER
ncbi:MAG: holo-ACP synthase [Actinomycetes bacterium]